MTHNSILTKYSMENSKDWDEEVQVALYAIYSEKQESLGYSPFELLFGRKPSENLRILHDSYEGREDT